MPGEYSRAWTDPPGHRRLRQHLPAQRPRIPAAPALRRGRPVRHRARAGQATRPRVGDHAACVLGLRAGAGRSARSTPWSCSRRPGCTPTRSWRRWRPASTFPPRSRWPSPSPRPIASPPPWPGPDHLPGDGELPLLPAHPEGQGAARRRRHRRALAGAHPHHARPAHRRAGASSSIPTRSCGAAIAIAIRAARSTTTACTSTRRPRYWIGEIGEVSAIVGRGARSHPGNAQRGHVAVQGPRLPRASSTTPTRPR